jgi:hypothetical protein
MFNFKLLLIVLLFSLSFAQAKTQNDSIIRNYLICKSTGLNVYSKIFKEGGRLLAVSNDGIKCRGHLKIINDTVFSLTNSMTLKCDTFNINQIRKLKNPNLVLTGFGILCIPLGISYAYAGYTLLGLGVLGDVIGSMLIFSGSISSLLGPLIINGPRINLNYYNLKIYQAKGFKLKKKHLKLLYPNN